MSRAALLIYFCLFSMGCSALNVQKPTAAITGMSVGGVDAKGFTMNFGVDLKNPNSMTLPLTGADYRVGLAGTKVADGTAHPEGSIPAGGTKNITVPVTLTYENLLASEQAIVNGGGNVPYTLDGALLFNTGTPLVGNVSVPLQYNGTLAVKEILKNSQAMMQNPAAQKLARELMSSFLSP